MTNPPNTDQLPDVLTMQEAARLAGISVSSLRTRIRENQVNSYKVGVHRYLAKAEVLAAIEAGTLPNQKKAPETRRPTLEQLKQTAAA